MRFRLDLSYDGTGFYGWASQPELRTVQSEIEHALALILRLDDLPRLTVAGRTDAGVHARGQVAHVDLADDVEPAPVLEETSGVRPATTAVSGEDLAAGCAIYSTMTFRLMT